MTKKNKNQQLEDTVDMDMVVLHAGMTGSPCSPMGAGAVWGDNGGSAGGLEDAAGVVVPW